VPYVVEIWEPKPPGTLWVTPGLLRDIFTFLNEVMKGHAAFLLEFRQIVKIVKKIRTSYKNRTEEARKYRINEKLPKR